MTGGRRSPQASQDGSGRSSGRAAHDEALRAGLGLRFRKGVEVADDVVPFRFCLRVLHAARQLLGQNKNKKRAEHVSAYGRGSAAPEFGGLET